MLPAADTPSFALPPCHEEAAALIPPPRLHRHRYHGVLAPNAAQRPLVIAVARQPAPPLPKAADASHARSPARYLWALLLARIFEVLVPA